MSKKILLIGGGGHCKSVLDSLLDLDLYSEIGIIDKKENVGKEILGIPIIGSDEELPRLFLQGFSEAFITVGSIGNASVRIHLFNLIQQLGFNSPNVIDSSAIVSANAILDHGIFVGKEAVVNAGVHIQNGAIINTASIIEHDCVVGKFAHIAPGVTLCGEVVIGAETHIGARSVVKQRICIGSNTMIGMGSVVLKEVGDDLIAYGNPCKEARRK